MSDVLQEVVKLKTKFVVVTGGVCSSLGKGVLVSSIGSLIKNAGYSVSVIKCDPYLNVDPGTMSPLVHGEVFVTNDGAETDLDLGHYERTFGVHLTRHSSISSGQIFQEILEGERKGKFLGRCIQMVPHVVDAIKQRILNLAGQTKADFVLVELGGTVGDIEGEVFLEAIRRLRGDLPEHMMHCHLSLVPFLSWAGEYKTKPTQHSVMILKRAGLTPDALFLRADDRLPQKSVEKLSVMCDVDKDLIFQVLSFNPIYKVFVDLYEQKLHQRVQKWFNISSVRDADLSDWKALIKLIEKPKPLLRIGMVVKYIGTDPYISVIEAIKAAAYACERDVEIFSIPAEELEQDIEKRSGEAWRNLTSVDGILVPGGFDQRGLQGKIEAVRWAREKKVPYLGLCLGMQVMLIEFARSVLGLSEAGTTEVNKGTKDPVISLLEEQEGVEQKGASMRLGAFPCTLVPGTKAHEAYGVDQVNERHRHRYEFNNVYREQFEQSGMVFSGMYKEKNLVEIAELSDHPFMVASQFHPEFLSTPLKAHPLFKAFITAIVAQKGNEKQVNV